MRLNWMSLLRSNRVTASCSSVTAFRSPFRMTLRSFRMSMMSLYSPRVTSMRCTGERRSSRGLGMRRRAVVRRPLATGCCSEGNESRSVSAVQKSTTKHGRIQACYDDATLGSTPFGLFNQHPHVVRQQPPLALCSSDQTSKRRIIKPDAQRVQERSGLLGSGHLERSPVREGGRRRLGFLLLTWLSRQRNQQRAERH